MNVQQAIIAALVVQSKAIEVEVEAMLAHDRGNGFTGTYTEQSYLDKAQALYAISNDIQQIARSGSLP